MKRRTFLKSALAGATGGNVKTAGAPDEKDGCAGTIAPYCGPASAALEGKEPDGGIR